MQLKRLAPIAALGVTVFAFSWASIVLFREGAVSAVWPANAVVLAFVIRWARNPDEAALGLGAAVGAMIGANIICGLPPLHAFGFPLGNGLEIALAAWLVRDVRAPLSGTRDLIRFLGGAVVAAPAAGAVVAAALMAASGEQNLIGAGVRWWLADALGMAVVAPVALSLRRAHLRRDRPGVAASIAAQLAVAAAAGLVFALPYPMFYLLFPLVMLAVFADREVGGAIAVAGVALIAVGATMFGYGPAAATPHGLFLVQGMLAALVLTIHPVAAVLRRLDGYTAVLERERARAVALSDTKTRFLAHVSHEIRSPLTGVVTVAELMASGALGVLTPRQHEMIERIAASGAEIDALSRDLIDAAAIQAGKAKAVLADVAVGEVVATAVETARMRTRDQGAKFVLGVVPAEAVLRADPARLRQALVNLLVNAAKYGGRPPVVQVDVVEVEGRVRITVSDNGRGVPPDRREAVFGDFDRAGAESTDIEGWGVGLSLSRELVRLQGGELGVSDGALGGAAFWIDLPGAPISAAA
ncbi:sensor histidine kinase [Caulobacter sp. 17J65-9]|uniref:sensor histidine kinase n=1 Tax=Caulobacter sp. 17J65-9 TaxID=2709382 RepID=UPI0013C6CF1A|nr:sensor histidine kinase [Caulobacter sp. 17J65-9]NEX92568.1 hypothetical protein [Caulobacter sp. 17J65-9]